MRFFFFFLILNCYSLNALSSVKNPLNKLIAYKDKGFCISLFIRDRSLVRKMPSFRSVNRSLLWLRTKQKKMEGQFLPLSWGEWAEGWFLIKMFLDDDIV